MFARTTALGLLVLLTTALGVPAYADKSASSKAFAVFAISYNEGNDLVVGGVMGTAFFISETKAVTAFHVLQSQSFKPNPGFQHKKVFLLHEDVDPIELSSNQIASVQSKDETVVHLSRRVPNKYVFEIESSIKVDTEVETEGFAANTAGPVLVREGKHIRIAKVPALERRRLRGHILRKSSVQLNAVDVHLNGVECVQLSYLPVVGFSGGPVLSARGRVLAMNSFAEPATRANTWAVSLARDQLH